MLDVGLRLDSARPPALTGVVLCLRTSTVVFNSLLSLTTQQGCFAATVCLLWKQTASAAKFSAWNVEEAVAAPAPVVGSVVVSSVSSLVLLSDITRL